MPAILRQPQWTCQVLLLTEPAQLLGGVLLIILSPLQARWCWCSEAAATTQTRPAHWQRPMQQACLSTTASQVSELVSVHLLICTVYQTILTTYQWNMPLPAAGTPHTLLSVPKKFTACSLCVLSQDKPAPALHISHCCIPIASTGEPGRGSSDASRAAQAASSSVARTLWAMPSLCLPSACRRSRASCF